MSGYPTDILGLAGYHASDLSAPICAGTWAAVAAAANVAVHGARIVAETGEAVYAACRPPGHHASRDRIGGFCFLNNAAIAAQEMLPLLAAEGRRPRVAILVITSYSIHYTKLYDGRSSPATYSATRSCRCSP